MPQSCRHVPSDCSTWGVCQRAASRLIGMRCLLSTQFPTLAQGLNWNAHHLDGHIEEVMRLTRVVSDTLAAIKGNVSRIEEALKRLLKAPMFERKDGKVRKQGHCLFCRLDHMPCRLVLHTAVHDPLQDVFCINCSLPARSAYWS